MNPVYTTFQLGFRILFVFVTLVIFCLYFTKLVIRLPRELRKFVTFEQRAAFTLVLLLLFFNGPFYAIHLVSPSLFTFVLTEVQSALFIASLLVYWLRELALYRPETAPENSSCL